MSKKMDIILQQPVVSLPPLTLVVLPAKIHHLRQGEYQGYDEGAQRDGVPENIFRSVKGISKFQLTAYTGRVNLRVSLDVNEGPDKGRAVCQRDDHTYADGPDIMRG